MSRGPAVTHDPFNQPPDRFPYGHSKWLAEAIVRERVKAGQDIVKVNPAAIIGARDINWISGSILREAKRGRIPVIPQGGVNFVAAQDVVARHTAAMEKGRPGERYILGGENLSYLQLYRTIAEVVGCRRKLKVMPRWLVPLTMVLTDVAHPHTAGPVPLTSARLRLESKAYYFDSSKARSTFAMPNTPLRVTIGRTYEWYESMGELAGVGEGPVADGAPRRCGRTSHRRWPHPGAAAGSAGP